MAYLSVFLEYGGSALLLGVIVSTYRQKTLPPSVLTISSPYSTSFMKSPLWSRWNPSLGSVLLYGISFLFLLGYGSTISLPSWEVRFLKMGPCALVLSVSPWPEGLETGSLRE